MIAITPQPPYYAVIFTSIKIDNTDFYTEVANRMVELAATIDGYLGIESARNEIGITISYWRDKEAILNWKKNAEHLVAQQLGREKFYASFTLRICLVEREYSFTK